MRYFFSGEDKMLLPHQTGSTSPYGFLLQEGTTLWKSHAFVSGMYRCPCRGSAKLGEDISRFLELLKRVWLGDIQFELKRLVLSRADV